MHKFCQIHCQIQNNTTIKKWHTIHFSIIILPFLLSLTIIRLKYEICDPYNQKSHSKCANNQLPWFLANTTAVYARTSRFQIRAKNILKQNTSNDVRLSVFVCVCLCMCLRTIVDSGGSHVSDALCVWESPNHDYISRLYPHLANQLNINILYINVLEYTLHCMERLVK